MNNILKKRHARLSPSWVKAALSQVEIKSLALEGASMLLVEEAENLLAEYKKLSLKFKQN